MRETGLTMRDFEVANERRHWLACHRILKEVERRKRSNLYISINAVAKATKSHWLTVRKALNYTAAFVLGKVRQAFILSVATLTRDTERSTGKSSLKPSEQDLSKSRSLRQLQERCLSRTAEALPKKDSCPDVKQRRELSHAASVAWQREIDKAKAAKGDGLCVTLRPHERVALFQKVLAPSRWREEVGKLKAKFTTWRNRRSATSQPKQREVTKEDMGSQLLLALHMDCHGRYPKPHACDYCRDGLPTEEPSDAPLPSITFAQEQNDLARKAAKTHIRNHRNQFVAGCVVCAAEQNKRLKSN